MNKVNLTQLKQTLLRPAVVNNVSGSKVLRSAHSTPGSSAPSLESTTSAFPQSHFAYDFSRVPVHSPAQMLVQTKLRIGQPRDIYEQKADRVADQVMRMSRQPPQHAYAFGGRRPKCQKKQLVHDHERLQAKRVQADNISELVAPPVVHEVLCSPGVPLNPTTRAFFEPRFGHDFSKVRVHPDARASEAAQAVKAKAFTVGQDIVFGTGQYAPNAAEGRRLLAHELVHTVQQTGRGPRFQSRIVQREATRPRAATGTDVISDLTSQTARQSPGATITAGSLARQEWESLFRRHFIEPDQVQDEVESSHARYFYSRIYGWIDAQHFFAHIQFAQDQGLEGATTRGIRIEQTQARLRSMIGPTPGDNTIYSDLLVHNLITPDDFLHYREGTFIAITAAMNLVLDAQQQSLIRGFTDRQLAKLILDNAMSAWSAEDMVSNQLGVQFFRLHGAFINAGSDANEVRQRFINRITTFFTTIEVINNPATVRRLARSLPGKERWTSSKMSEARARSRYPELFNFSNRTHRIRIATYDRRGRADRAREEVGRAVPSAPGLHVTSYGTHSFALYTGALSHFEAVLLKNVIDRSVITGEGGALIEEQP